MIASHLQSARASVQAPRLTAQNRPTARRSTVCITAHASRGDVAVSAAAAAAAVSTKPSKCPFAGLADLLPHKAVPAPPSPVTKAGGPQFATPHLWLAAGVSGQNVPGKLVPGIKKLDPKVSLSQPAALTVKIKSACARVVWECCALLFGASVAAVCSACLAGNHSSRAGCKKADSQQIPRTADVHWSAAMCLAQARGHRINRLRHQCTGACSLRAKATNQPACVRRPLGSCCACNFSAEPSQTRAAYT